MIGTTPWYVKVGAKLALGSIPGAKERLSRLLPIFRHGPIDDPAYCVNTFLGHYARFLALAQVSVDDRGFRVLELGPGLSMASGLLAYVFGAERCYLVDVGEYASLTDESANRILDVIEDGLMAGSRERPIPEEIENTAQVTQAAFDKSVTTRENILARIETLRDRDGIARHLLDNVMTYMCDGVDSMREIPDESIDLCFSEAVLEHVLHDEFRPMLEQLSRVTVTGGVGSHAIDFKDHLGASLHSLRFPRKLWESRWVYNAGFYTNRLRWPEVKQQLESLGWRVTVVSEKKWESLPLPRSSMQECFRHLPDDHLLCSGVTCVSVRSRG